MIKLNKFLALFSLIVVSSVVHAEYTCEELYQHLKNYERTKTILIQSKITRDDNVTVNENDGKLWEWWQKLERLKKEKDEQIEKNCQ